MSANTARPTCRWTGPEAPQRWAIACRARAVILNLEGQRDEAAELLELADRAEATGEVPDADTSSA